MKKNTTFSKLIQNLLSDDEMSKITASIARQLTIRVLIEYMVMAATCEWKSLRCSSDVGAASGLIHVDYSALSKKLKQLDFRLMKEVFVLIIGKCNRVKRRTIKIPNQLLLVDSATITVGKTRLPWAVYHGSRVPGSSFMSAFPLKPTCW